MQVVIVKEHFFSIGIAVLLLMTLYYGVNAVVPPPEVKQYSSDVAHQIEWAQGGYQTAQRRHQGIVCAIYLPVGFLTLLLGSFRMRLELLRAAFIFGGLFMMITAIASGWESYSIRFAASVVTLTAVIIIVRRQFSNGLDKPPGGL